MTGSGKTAAFVLPTLHHLMARQGPGPRALIITPTRELASQVASDLDDLAAHTRVRCKAVYGGVSMRPQEEAFRRGADVIVATPGRLLDHLQHRYASLQRVEILILDEADRMLDMGFLPDIRRILQHVPKKRQTLFFSATMPPPIERLAKDLLHSPVAIAVERRSAPAAGVRQKAVKVPQDGKNRLFLDLLGQEDVRSVLAFTRTKRRANLLTTFLTDHGVAAARIHGNRSQAQREKALDSFKKSTIRVLVATDIAARGIDIEDLSHVVNYDVPNVADDYIHRVGRTARANRTGDAITFVAPEEEVHLRTIEKALGHRIDRANAPSPATRPAARSPVGRDASRDAASRETARGAPAPAERRRPRRASGASGNGAKTGGAGRSSNAAKAGGAGRSSNAANAGGAGRSPRSAGGASRPAGRSRRPARRAG
jgi:ATP-dependent RNA helicase RhlE